MAIRVELLVQIVACGAILFCILGQVWFLINVENSKTLRMTRRQRAIPVRTRWVFIHYHKSGHDIAKNLQAMFVERGCANASVHISKRVDILPIITSFANDDISVLSAPDLQFQWQVFIKDAIEDTRIVHFVRDPVEMILSGFLYHMQSPSPRSEQWLLKDLDICELNPNNDKYIQIISSYTGANNSTMANQIIHVHGLCLELQNRYKDISVYGTMRNASKNSMHSYDGIKLEAVRSLISSHYGDLLRMTANSVYESSAPSGLTHRVFTSELPVGEIDIFTHTMSTLLNYLMNDTVVLPHTHIHKPFWEHCMNKSATLQYAIDRIYVPTTDSENVRSSESKVKNARISIKDSKSAASQHITQGLITPGLREYHKHRLLQDAVLGPVLHTIREVLYRTGRQQ